MAWYWPFKRSQPADPEPIAKALPPGSGIGGFQPTVTPPPETKPAGADGVAIIGGFVVSNERDRKLTGTQKWVTYDNQILNIAIIASAVNVWTQLAGSAKWTVEPNKRGGKDAEKAADIVTQGLIEAQLSTPWRQIVRRQVMKKFRGFSMHEVILRRRSDDMIVVADIQDRPQWTIWRWNRPDPQAEWIGVEQWTQLAGSGPWYIPRERLFYSVENTLSSSPEGIGLLRQTAEPARVFELYRRFEGIGLQTDLRGIPLALAPLQEIVEAAKKNGAATDAQIQSYVRAATNDLVSFLAAHNKDERQGILLDSAPFKDATGNPTGFKQWGFDLVKGSASSLPDVNTAIGRETRDIARIMCAEWLLLGGEDSGGAYSMHEDKTAMFGLCVNSALEDVADDANRDIATRLVAMNGLDPETCTPKLVPEPIATGAVKEACQSLMFMMQAALDPRDKAINVLRGRLNLPPAPEIDESMLILPHGATVERLGPGGAPVSGGGGAPGKPSKPPAGAGEAGNANARPEAADGAVGKYAPEQPRDEGGRWASGDGGSPRPWTRAFDSRDHMRQIEEHRQAEDYHRGQAGQLHNQITTLQARMRSADPGRQPKMQERIDRLSAQRDEHRLAASAARVDRTKVRQDMEEQRSAHAAGLREQSMQRRQAAEARAQREAIGMVGESRIGGGEGHPDVVPASHPVQPSWIPTEEDTHDALNHAESERAKQSAALDRQEAERAHAALVDRLNAQQSSGSWHAGDSGRTRQVVTPADAGPKTQQEWNEHDAQRRQRELASDNRAHALATQTPTREPLPTAETHSPRPGVLDRLRGLLSHKSADPEFAKMLEDVIEDLEIE